VFTLIGFAVLAEGLGVFRIKAVATGGRRFQSGSLGKEIWLDEYLGVEAGKVSATKGGSHFGLRGWVKQAVPLLNYTLAFALQLKNISKTSVRVAE
jgi:hypothetical protein